MKPEVTELALAQCSPAGAVLARAFLEEPWWSAVIPDRDRRRRALPSIMTADLRHGLLSGQLAEATPSLRAVSWWEPPGYQDTFLPWLRCLPSLGATVWRATPADLRRMFAALGQWNRIRQGIAPRPHWYLATLGADPEHQNLGLAARLALHGLARADADGVDSILQTESARNVRLYEKMGFHVVDHCDDEVLGIPVWRILRPPGTTTQAMDRILAARP